jgi:hypothetical protein
LANFFKRLEIKSRVVLTIDACHCFDWMSVKMQYIGIVTALIVICKSMLMILIVGMMHAEARTIV